MKILKRGAAGSDQSASQSKLKPASRNVTRTASGANATAPAAGAVVTVPVRATLVQWLLATLVGMTSGAILGFLVFTIYQTNW